MFRKLYWVTEHVYVNGESKVLGVYTSIPDLIRHGLQQAPRGGILRLTLTKLDSCQEPLGTWMQPNFEGIEQRLEEFVATDEFTKEHCNALCKALRQEAVHATAA
ncbi:hypothetical protein BH11ARM1_BH11ARM1_08450 [soil metagenome]